jgi:hypothetical protein
MLAASIDDFLWASKIVPGEKTSPMELGGVGPGTEDTSSRGAYFGEFLTDLPRKSQRMVRDGSKRRTAKAPGYWRVLLGQPGGIPFETQPTDQQDASLIRAAQGLAIAPDRDGARSRLAFRVRTDPSNCDSKRIKSRRMKPFFTDGDNSRAGPDRFLSIHRDRR